MDPSLGSGLEVLGAESLCELPWLVPDVDAVVTADSFEVSAVAPPVELPAEAEAVALDPDASVSASDGTPSSEHPALKKRLNAQTSTTNQRMHRA